MADITETVGKHRPKDRPSDEFDYVDISSIEANKIVASKCLVGKDAPSRARQLLKAGDTVLSTVRTYLKNTALVPPHLDGATASTGFSVLRPKAEVVEPRFLFYRVLENQFVNQLSEKQTGTNYPAVRDRDVRAMPVCLPSLEEQQRIVEVVEEQFSRVDAGVESLQRAKRNLAHFRSTAVRSLFDPEWPLIQLGEMSEVVGGITKDSQRESDSDAVEIPYLRVANVQRGYLDLSEVKTIRAPFAKIKFLLLQPGDVLLTEGGDRDKLGRGWVWRGELARCIHQNHIFRARLEPRNFVPEFVSLYANHFGQQWFERMGKQTTNLASISLTVLKRFPIPAPALKDQQRVVAEVERQFSIIDSMAKTIDAGLRRAAALRQSILSQAFSGRLTAAT